MLSSLFVVALAVLSGIEAQSPVEGQFRAPVNPDQTAQPIPTRESPALKAPFRKLFLEPPASSIVRLELAPQELAANPNVECGLLVWHVDARKDPKILVRREQPNPDPKIAREWHGPCTDSRGRGVPDRK
jgi:hypothetical protein